MTIKIKILTILTLTACNQQEIRNSVTKEPEPEAPVVDIKEPNIETPLCEEGQCPRDLMDPWEPFTVPSQPNVADLVQYQNRLPIDSNLADVTDIAIRLDGQISTSNLYLTTGRGTEYAFFYSSQLDDAFTPVSSVAVFGYPYTINPSGLNTSLYLKFTWADEVTARAELCILSGGLGYSCITLDKVAQ